MFSSVRCKELEKSKYGILGSFVGLRRHDARGEGHEEPLVSPCAGDMEGVWGHTLSCETPPVKSFSFLTAICGLIFLTLPTLGPMDQ